MRHTKASVPKAFITVVKRIFRARNVIIISEHKVDHVPLSATLQVLLLVGVVGFFSGVSYITGSYMTASSAIKERDAKIVNTTIEKTRIGEEMGLLKRDLVKLSQNGKEMSSYSKFIVDQYVNNAPHNAPAAANNASLSSAGFFGQNNDKLLDRISYLENRMQEVRDENEHLVLAIRERTDKKINYFEDIIAMTGLDSDKLERMATTNAAKPGNAVSSAAPLDPTADETAKKEHPHGAQTADNQGGPYIPYDSASFNDSDRELLANVDRLVLLHDIIGQLPLRQPIADAQTTGPFGKRVDPINGHWAIHPGVDMAGPAGAVILSASGGKVVSAGHKAAYGNMVDIDHGFGIVTRYAHLSRIIVHEGEIVHRGQQIGVQGSTGRSTGPHLHYEVRINDRPVNPVKFLHAGEYVLEN